MKKRTSSSKLPSSQDVETYIMTGGQKSVVENGKRVVKPYRPLENYIVKEPLRYINGENCYVPQSEINDFVQEYVARGLRARAKTLCEHPSWTVWQEFDGMQQRRCLTCHKTEYKL